MEPLVRAFLVRETHGWDYETTLERYLEADPVLVAELGPEMIPTSRRSGGPGTSASASISARRSNGCSILRRAVAADVPIPRDLEPNCERRTFTVTLTGELSSLIPLS